ncbi:hypothetical protein LCGC14_0547570 [marine sediment metagenome]|uniref:Uncharacterized protein n=1 Tax=marine sediment metagenome TaxID=412755 RepID=A0A0F9RQW6_9ZZZZ
MMTFKEIESDLNTEIQELFSTFKEKYRSKTRSGEILMKLSNVLSKERYRKSKTINCVIDISYRGLEDET